MMDLLRWTGTSMLFALAAACSSTDDETGTGSGGSGGAGSSGGGTTSSGGGSASGDDVCAPVGDGCGVAVVGGPESGAECLAMRDNAGADRVQLRQTWTRITRPVGNTIDTVYRVLQQRAELPLSACNMLGVSGYIKVVDWDRSASNITEQTARVGWADFVASDGRTAVSDGLCLAELDYVDPDHGLDTPWAVAPVVQRRVEADFTVAEVRGTLAEGEGIFYFDEATGLSHHYSPLEYVLIFDSESKVSAVPIHDAEMTIRFNDAETLNCAGVYRDGDLVPANDCKSLEQDSPPWGCADEGCPAGEGPVETHGWFSIVEIEKVFTTVLQSTLCVSYPGQQNSIDNGWADPADWGLNCSGSPQWDPNDLINGIPEGDWCSETNADATADCHDAWRSHAFGTMAGFNVQTENCASDAQAAGAVEK